MGDKIPKTIALGLTKKATDGRIISINHPNPTGKVLNKKQYRSLKNDRVMLLPQNYQARDSNAQNGEWQCPVDGCDTVFTRKAGLLMHMERPTGHKDDLLRDTGNGTFAKIHPALIDNGAADFINNQADGFINDQADDFINNQADDFINDRADDFINDRADDFINDQADDFINNMADDSINNMAERVNGIDGKDFREDKQIEAPAADGGESPQRQTADIQFEYWMIREKDYDNEFIEDFEWVMSIHEGRFDNLYDDVHRR
ncbi:hypothetical protein V501_03217 [Pseudogymnoascus sp. VKM F-4519 (FW-2642)]|nr:hypothetical protein V501_03217 [Pseudogymnoascus sp. VKM F-4519 (FW-2642)]